MYNFRTDLADERRDIYRSSNNISNEIEGIETSQEKTDSNININRVKIINEKRRTGFGKT